jgi:hypothetical protein
MPDEVSIPILRDFLYVDIARVRSFLAQMAEGVPEQLVSAVSSGRQRQGGLQLPPISFQATGSNNRQMEETRSLNDSLFMLFEEAAESLGWLRDISEEAADMDAWASGRLHQSLPASSIIRITSSTRLVDATHFRTTLERVVWIMQAVGDVSGTATQAATRGSGGRPGSGAQRQGHQQRRAAARQDELPGGVSAKQVNAIGSLVESLMPAGLSINIMPLGEANSRFALSGTLLDRAEYLEPERAALFGRYGVAPSEWTTVALVTRSTENAARPDLDNLGEITNADGSLNRDAFEAMASGLLTYLEQVGMTEAPQAPGIGVTPLGIYRLVPRVD